jgi:hypothetical protein
LYPQITAEKRIHEIDSSSGNRMRITLRTDATVSHRGFRVRWSTDDRAGNKIRFCWDRCYDFLNIFAENLSKNVGVFDSKQSYIMQNFDHNIGF